MASNPPRVFIDASVLFAASLSATGFARDLIKAPTSGSSEVFVSSFVLEETRRNLGAKAPRALPFFHAFQAAGIVQMVEPDPELVRLVAQIIVLKDAPIVAGAIKANALYLASYDRKHLLSQAALIKDQFGVLVDAPDNVLATIESSTDRDKLRPPTQ
jgi:predicted nucleic acid-binding protein